MSLALGLDLGTSSLSAAAVDAGGRLVAGRNAPNPAAVPGLPEGWAEQDPAVVRAAAVRLLREMAQATTERPVCLGLTGQMHGGLLADRRRRPLTNLVTWQDRRANEPLPDGSRSLLDEFRARCDPAAVQRTGCFPSPGYLGVTLFAMVQRGGIPSDAFRAVTLADWMAAELTDGEPVTDRSNAAATGLFDLVDDGWSDSLVAATGAARELLPDVRDSGAVLGGLSPEMAAETGLPAGLPVCNAIGDNQAAVLGSVPAGESAIQINVGTGGQINWPVDTFVRVDGMDTRYLPHRRFMLVGAGLAGGDAYSWVQRTVAAWLAAFGVSVDEATLYETIHRLAEGAPRDAGGLSCEPAFRGTRRQPSLRGCFTGVGVDNFTPGHVARAVLTGIAQAMKWFYDHAGTARPEQLRRIIGSGNGLRRNPLLAQALADVFGREVWFAEHDEEAAYGAALLAGTTVGLWPDLATAGGTIQLRRAVQPSQ